MIGRMSVLVVAVIALCLSLNPSDTILDLVGYAWAGFGSSFGPVILLCLYWKRMNHHGALVGMIVGAVVVLTWITTGLNHATGIYEMIPGFTLSGLGAIIVSLLTSKPSKASKQLFNKMENHLEEETK